MIFKEKGFCCQEKTKTKKYSSIFAPPFFYEMPYMMASNEIF